VNFPNNSKYKKLQKKKRKKEKNTHWQHFVVVFSELIPFLFAFVCLAGARVCLALPWTRINHPNILQHPKDPSIQASIYLPIVVVLGFSPRRGLTFILIFCESLAQQILVGGLL